MHMTWRDIVHWLAERHNTSSIRWWESYFNYERSKGSTSQKREREMSLYASGDELLAWRCCFSYEMEGSKWGASHQVVFNNVTSERSKNVLSKLLFFSIFEHIVDILRIADIDMHAIVASVLFKTQLLHDTRHFVQSSLGLGYSVKASFSIVRFFFF